MDARRLRLGISYASLGVTGATAAICAYYLIVGFDYSRDSTLMGSVSSAWKAQVEAAGASLQASAWARLAIVFGIISFSTYPFAGFVERTLLERAGLVSRQWKKAVASWAFIASASLLAIVSVLNYYANATTWAVRWDLFELMQFVGLVQLNTAIYEPIGIVSGAGEIAKWFAILLVLTIVSFFFVRMGRGMKGALSDSVLGLLCCLFLYEVGLVFLCSNYDYVWVTALQIGTPLQWLSNSDLLYLSSFGFATLFLAKLAKRRSRFTIPASRRETL